MSGSTLFQLNRAKIIFEPFEDETVLVNVQSGFYYSLSGAGSEILRLIEEGCPIDQLPHRLFADSEASTRRGPVEDFVRQLIDESIIVARSDDNVAPLAARTDPPLHLRGIEYAPPVLERFDEVRDLLLIDPVHEVDQEYGWPRTK